VAERFPFFSERVFHSSSREESPLPFLQALPCFLVIKLSFLPLLLNGLPSLPIKWETSLFFFELRKFFSFFLSPTVHAVFFFSPRSAPEDGSGLLVFFLSTPLSRSFPAQLVDRSQVPPPAPRGIFPVGPWSSAKWNLRHRPLAFPPFEQHLLVPTPKEFSFFLSPS